MKILLSFQSTKRKLQSVFIIALLIFLCITPGNALADTGPHPTMDFELRYNNVTSVSVVGAKLMFCTDLDCKISQTVAGPFNCNSNSCSYSYGGNTYYKLLISYSDRTRESNVFQKTRFSSSFIVVVSQDDLQVTEKWSGWPYEPEKQGMIFLAALLITLPIELLTAGIFLKLKKQPYRPLPIIKANLISLPLVWFAFPFIRLDGFAILFVAELFALLFETWYLQRNYENMSRTTSFWLSLSINLASFLVPVFLNLPVY
jgi:hypothetical protein